MSSVLRQQRSSRRDHQVMLLESKQLDYVVHDLLPEKDGCLNFKPCPKRAKDIKLD